MHDILQIPLPFFIGLLEGDGSIQVNHWRQRSLQYRVLIKLKNDSLGLNAKMLRTLRDQVQLGRLYVRADYILWQIQDRDEICKWLDLLAPYGHVILKFRRRLDYLQHCLFGNVTYAELLALRSDLVSAFPMEPLDYSKVVTSSWFGWW